MAILSEVFTGGRYMSCVSAAMISSDSAHMPAPMRLATTSWPRPVRSRLYRVPDRGKTGGRSGSLMRDWNPARAQNAVKSNPGFPLSGPVRP